MQHPSCSSGVSSFSIPSRIQTPGSCPPPVIYNMYIFRLCPARALHLIAGLCLPFVDPVYSILTIGENVVHRPMCLNCSSMFLAVRAAQLPVDLTSFVGSRVALRDLEAIDLYDAKGNRAHLRLFTTACEQRCYSVERFLCLQSILADSAPSVGKARSTCYHSKECLVLALSKVHCYKRSWLSHRRLRGGNVWTGYKHSVRKYSVTSECPSYGHSHGHDSRKTPIESSSLKFSPPTSGATHGE